MVSDIIKNIDDLKSYKREFILHPEQWRTCQVQDLEWQSVKFCDDSAKNIPMQRGIYSFIVQHISNSFPSNAYVMYFGITGDTNSRTLRTRYKEYLRERTRAKRVRIHEMLVRWDQDMYFYFVPIPDKSVSLADIETNLLTAIIPPFNERDFVGKFGNTVKAAWT